MKCPFCPEESQDYLSVDDLSFHINKEHPEQTMTADAYAKALSKILNAQQLLSVASNLAHTVVMGKKTTKEVVDVYQDILRLLLFSPI